MPDDGSGGPNPEESGQGGGSQAAHNSSDKPFDDKPNNIQRKNSPPSSP